MGIRVFQNIAARGSSRRVETGIPRAARWVHPGPWDNPDGNVTYYQQELYILDPDRVLWNPYADQKDIGAEAVLDQQAFETALCKTYLIFNNIAERYLSNRALRQFRPRQPILANPSRW
ncbi:hypothetical protein AMTRI_Chr11g98200 [Amborella trichopoda]